MPEIKEIIVIGSGIIGVNIALQLLRRGQKVTLIEKNEPSKKLRSLKKTNLAWGALTALQDILPLKQYFPCLALFFYRKYPPCSSIQMAH
jgi:glycine/D-amino acid oxidase-like deaminating enzyme